MTPLIRIAAFALREERPALWRGVLLSVAVLVAGALLLGLSGWFITAAGAAGLAGIGIAFDVFRPSAGVRFLALGRTAARYGERVLTHDATLRVLARMRVHLLGRLAAQSAADLTRLRSPALLNRVTSDVDALDGVAIRLIFPILAGAITLVLAAILLSLLVSPLIAVAVVGLLVVGGAATMIRLGRHAVQPAAEVEAARQSLRSGTVEHLRARIVLAFSGALLASRDKLREIDGRLRRSERRIFALDRQANVWVSATGLLASGAALAIGGSLALGGHITPAAAAIAVFAALALVEVLAPLHRAMAEVGRMRDAAGRVAPLLDSAAPEENVSGASTLTEPAKATGLRLSDLSFAAPDRDMALTAPVSMDVPPGETVALTGRSGMGKSTLLSVVAGLAAPLGGQIEIEGVPLNNLETATLRRKLGYLPQRSQLMSGTVRDALRLAAQHATEGEMAEVIEALGLTGALAPRGGLDAKLGEAGSGLSGGEARRLALARVVLRRPDILLLDEPTEGLDAKTAERVLHAVRQLLPRAAILLTTHKQAELALCTRHHALKDIN